MTERIGRYLNAVRQGTLDEYYNQKEKGYVQRRKKVEVRKGPRRKKQ